MLAQPLTTVLADPEAVFRLIQMVAHLTPQQFFEVIIVRVLNFAPVDLILLKTGTWVTVENISQLLDLKLVHYIRQRGLGVTKRLGVSNSAGVVAIDYRIVKGSLYLHPLCHLRQHVLGHQPLHLVVQ